MKIQSADGYRHCCLLPSETCAKPTGRAQSSLRPNASHPYHAAEDANRVSELGLRVVIPQEAAVPLGGDGARKTSVRTAQLSFSAGAGVPGDTQPPAPATKGRRLRVGRLRGGDASPRGRTAAGLPLPPGPTRRPQLRRFPLPPALRGGGAGRAARPAAGSGPGPGGGGGGGGREEEGPGALRGSHVCPLGGRPRPPAGKPPPDAGGKRLLPAPSRRRKGGHGPSCHLQPRGQGTEPCGTDGQQRIPSGFLEEAARNARSQSGRGGGGGRRAPSGAFFALCNKVVRRADTVNECREKCLTS